MFISVTVRLLFIAGKNAELMLVPICGEKNGFVAENLFRQCYCVSYCGIFDPCCITEGNQRRQQETLFSEHLLNKHVL